MARAFLSTGDDLNDTAFRVVLVFPDSGDDWLFLTFCGLLINASDVNAWQTGGNITPQQAADAFKDIYDTMHAMQPMIGWIFDFPGTAAPINCLACDGTAYARVDYPDLYALLAPAFIVDADTFKTPDLRGKYKRGLQSGHSVGDALGADDVTIGLANMPAHQHSLDGYIPGVAVSPGELPVLTDVAVPSGTGFTGSSSPLSVIPASLVLLPCIVAKNP